MIVISAVQLLLAKAEAVNMLAVLFLVLMLFALVPGGLADGAVQILVLGAKLTKKRVAQIGITALVVMVLGAVREP